MATHEVQAASEDTRPVRGIPKSGRVWKPVATERFSAMVVKKATPWEVKQQEREKKKMTKALVEQLKADKAKAQHKERLRIDARRKQKRENELKSQVVQKITNSKKLKKMSKKQLKNIVKR